MRLYNFTRLIKKYSVSFTLHKSHGGRYVGGKWEVGEDIVEKMTGAIVPISDSKIYGSGGTYTTQDRELYLSKPLKSPLSDYRVVYKGNTYAIENARNFEDYADVVVYTLKQQSKAVGKND